jgi:ferredoxin
MPGADPSDNVIFIIDDDVCTRCALCVDRCPTGVIILGKAGAPDPEGDSHTRTNNHGYGYGMRL